MPPIASLPWSALASRLQGELHTDDLHRILFATDASVYRELPLAVAFPRSEEDVAACVDFARTHRVPLTPRAGGTSLAGQAVGAGLVVDVSRHMRDIIEINPEAGYAVVQPGVIRDQLNAALRPLGYWFGPNTSTANRCTLGGMFGNNSCGSTSITVGATRDHVRSARAVLADGTVQTFGDGARENEPAGLLADVHGFLRDTLSDAALRERILAAFPKAEVTRRNNGYALDHYARRYAEAGESALTDLCPLLAGSEGTLAFTTRLTVNIFPLPPAGSAVVALHFHSIDASLRATQAAMATRPFMCELMDDTILNLALENPDQRRNAAFVEGNPRALLLVEYRAATDAEALQLARKLGDDLSRPGSVVEPAYAAPALAAQENTERVWALRAAGLGILGNMVGDAKAVACIEDTAVALPDLADYIEEFRKLMDLYGQHPIYYAHAGAGELHLRPILDLKTEDGRERFYLITRDVARLVKKYRGSLSGEHGDGRVRAQFLEEMLGPEVYRLLVELKRKWDPYGIFNPGKIVEAPPMNEGLRYAAGRQHPAYATALDFQADGGILRSAEKCNGSGDCRKLTGGAMCPSYRATLQEKDSTRGRANVLREVLTQDQRQDPFANPALGEAMELCLSCKACTSECPSSVNMTNLKAEYLHQRQQRGGVSLRNRLVAANESLYRLGGKAPRLGNALLRVTAPVVKRVAGIAAGRSLPAIPPESLRSFYERERPGMGGTRGRLFFFGDEFINYQDVAVGQAALRLWWKLGYTVEWPRHQGSGRAEISKGMLDVARRRAANNLRCFHDRVGEDAPLVGLEPSAILGFRDEYPKLLRDADRTAAVALATHAFTFDEWLYREVALGRLGPDNFGPATRRILLHVHCHEKALGDSAKCASVLALPRNYDVTLLDSGCCGMAGSFGYEAEHYELSRRIAEQSLLSKIRAHGGERPDSGIELVAAGTSCRHTIKDELSRRARHTAEVLLDSWD